MKSSQPIEVHLANGNSEPLRLSNVIIEIHFFTNGNFRYAFGAGRTDDMGRSTVSYSDLEKQRHEDSEYNLMDYNTKLDDCDSTVELIVLSEQELRERNKKALRYFDAPLPWTKNWPSNARVQSTPQKIELVGLATTVRIPCKLL